ncbi:MAG TPA: endonuclease domain-containing protein [Anaerolineae bacterium]|nr:endonuclease domain-containing protein [Anaerolineae bacterium]
MLDVYCADQKLMIEIDGDSHFGPDQIEYDQARTKWLNEEGYRVIRFTNREVVNQFEAVLEKTLEECSRPSPKPSPRYALRASVRPAGSTARVPHV